MSKKELVEKASDPVGGGATGVSKSAEPHGGTATLPNSKKQGDTASKKLDGEVQDTDSANNTKAVGDAAAKNKASVSMKEEIDGLFGDDLSEEFKQKASVVFEAAVASRVAEQREAIEEQFAADKQQLEESFEQQVAEIKEELSTQVSEYLDYVVEQWMTANEVAIESSLKTMIAEEFIEKLRGLFEESYIQVPEQKLDVVQDMADKIDELEAKLNEAIAQNIELKNVVEAKKQDEIFAGVSEGLALTQVEKFRTLAEGVDYDDAENYRKKLEIVKEQYFGEKKVVAAKSIEESEIVELDEEVTPVKLTNGPVANYVSAIARTAKK